MTLVKSIRGPEGKASAWRRVVKLIGFDPADDAGEIHSGLSGMLVHAVAALLVSTVVADRLDDETRLQAVGIWSAYSRRSKSAIARTPTSAMSSYLAETEQWDVAGPGEGA